MTNAGFTRECSDGVFLHVAIMTALQAAPNPVNVI